MPLVRSENLKAEIALGLVGRSQRVIKMIVYECGRHADQYSICVHLILSVVQSFTTFDTSSPLCDTRLELCDVLHNRGAKNSDI